NIYRASVAENSSKKTLVTKVSAADADIGANGEVRYTFRHKAETMSGVFEIDEISGEIFVNGIIDFEKIKKYEINVDARDYGGFTDSCAVIIDIIDVNDNMPVITLTSFTNPVSEDVLPGTTLAVINVKDLDSGENGQINCFVGENSPFVIRSSLTSYFTLETTEQLDRETQSEYNHVYNYEVCMTTDSRKGDCKFVRPCSESVVFLDSCVEEKHGPNERDFVDKANISEQ
ncbi:hypothetical protein Z043_125707, partial [Scleropages formosus]